MAEENFDGDLANKTNFQNVNSIFSKHNNINVANTFLHCLPPMLRMLYLDIHIFQRHRVVTLN